MELYNGNGAVSNISVRINNRNRVLRFLFDVKSATQLEIKSTLNLSGPTVTQTLQFFKERSLLADGEEIPSVGGRKPRPIVFCYDAYHAVGVEVRRHHIDISVLDLHGYTVVQRTFRLLFESSEAYWRAVNDRVQQVLESRCEKRPILGVCVGFPGELSPSGDKISRATVLGVNDLPVASIQQGFDMPVHVEYGANAAAFGMVWRRKDMQDAVYVIITDNGVAGAVILDNRIYRGKSGKPGAFGHIVLEPGGELCACGGRGCWASYCSLTSLTQMEEPNLHDFFERLNAGNAACVARWDGYLSRLAQGLANIYLSFDVDIIIGGKLAPYLEPWMEELRERISAYPVLVQESPNVLLNTESEHPIAEGAAMMLIDSFLNDELAEMRFETLK